jgi:opacity protein-like surface antigen
MKKILLAIAAVASLGAAASASAAPYGYGPGPGNGVAIDQRIADINARIDRGARNGSLSVREARNLRGQLDGVRRLEVRYGRDGLDGRERAELNGRLDRLSYQVRGDRHDGERRW